MDSMYSGWGVEVPLTLKDVQCFLLKNTACSCWQLCQTISGWVAILCRVDSSLQ